jgi:hypothetical protein
MDLARLAATFAVLAIGLGLGRLVLGTIGHTGEVLASLFVPPDRALGWPRGVQESDEPWGWRGGAPPSDGSRPDDVAGPSDGGDLVFDRPTGPYVVPVRRVRRR